jgi:NADPH:quinone reductase-like Zn-dependent oxidoreductase
MKAVRLHAFGDASNLKVEDVPRPTPGPRQVLVRVAASSLNHVETYLRQGYLEQVFPVSLPATLGIDLAGEVEEVGPQVTGFSRGDRVIGRLAINGQGSHAEYALAEEGQLARLPANVDFQTGATLPLAGLTGRQGVDAAKVKPGDTVLVTGALGAVGRAAVQYLRESGINVVAAVLPARDAEARAMGLQTVSLDTAEPASFDAAVDAVGGPVAEQALRAVKDGGVVASAVGFPEGAGEDGRVQAITYFSGDNGAMLQQIADAAGRGDLSIPVGRTFPLDDLAAAYDLLATQPAGKIVITR